jgi:hypothetical protein
VHTNPATVHDFLSYQQLGKPLFRESPTARRQWEGISVYETFEQAAKQAENLGYSLGEFVAEVAISDDAAISIEPGRPSSGHRTLRVDPPERQAEILHALIVRIVSVRDR